MQAKIKQLAEKLAITFHDEEILLTALVHRSYLNEHSNWHTDHNERLEFLGDAVLELVVTDYLFRSYSNPEGELTNWRAALVRGVTLKDVADSLELGKYLYLSKGEEISGGRQRELILANAVEALIGAIYIDQGYQLAEKFIQQYIISRLPDILASKSYQDAKSHLQELSQEKIGITPVYKLIAESGPDHNKEFLMGVYIGENEYGQGQGSSKQLAEQAAAEQALKNWSDM